MFSSITTKLQMQQETMEIYGIIIYFRELFDKHARSEGFEISKLLFSNKLQVAKPSVQHADKHEFYYYFNPFLHDFCMLNTHFKFKL